MSVLEAVRGWEYIAKLPHIGQEENEEGSDEEEEAAADEEEEALQDGLWTAQELDNGLDELLGTDYVSLLLEHDKHVGAATTQSLRTFATSSFAGLKFLHGVPSAVHDLAGYLPDSFVPQYQVLRNTALSWLQSVGVVQGDRQGVASSGTQGFHVITTSSSFPS
jgi:protein kinase C substrate 80K-H